MLMWVAFGGAAFRDFAALGLGFAGCDVGGYVVLVFGWCAQFRALSGFGGWWLCWILCLFGLVWVV